MEENLEEEKQEYGPDEYTVEQILGRRINIETKKVEYLLKWQGFSDEYNTWEPEDNVFCEDLLKEYNKIHGSPYENNVDKKEPENDSPSQNLKNERSKKKKKGKQHFQEEPDQKIVIIKKGFSQNLVPELIVGATMIQGELLFLIKWQDLDEADLVPASEANIKCPKLVIKYYEERLIID